MFFTKFLCAVVFFTALFWFPASVTPTTAQGIWLQVGPECCYVFFNGAWVYDYHSWHYHYYQGRNYPNYYRWNGAPRYYQRYYYDRGHNRHENWQNRGNNNQQQYNNRHR